MTATADFLRRAAERDAAGDHDEAINELSRGTMAGDLPCLRALGLRLLTGDRAPLLRKEGLQFLGEACERGLPEAAARAAGILAVGIHAPADWMLALAWLTRSAQGGWASAQAQLLALCDDRALATRLAARAADGAAVDWRELAAAVRLADWRRAPPGEVRSADPRVVAVPGFLRPELCAWFIAGATGRLEPAKVYDPVARQTIVDAHRNNTLATFDVPSVEMAHALVQARMAAACGMDEHFMEAPSVLHYAPGEQIRDHYDFVDPKSVDDYAAELALNGQRRITFLVYLNEDYEGGETAFPKLGFSHRGRCGDGFFFVNSLSDHSPDLRTLHAGRPPTRGEKWIITQFVRSRRTR